MKDPLGRGVGLDMFGKDKVFLRIEKGRNGKRQTADGKWQMANGKWQMADRSLIGFWVVVWEHLTFAISLFLVTFLNLNGSCE